MLSVSANLLSVIFTPHVINNSNRTEWSPIQSVIKQVIKKIGWSWSGSLICYSQVWLQTELDNTKSFYHLIITMTISEKIHLEEISNVENV